MGWELKETKHHRLGNKMLEKWKAINTYKVKIVTTGNKGVHVWWDIKQKRDWEVYNAQI